MLRRMQVRLSRAEIEEHEEAVRLSLQDAKDTAMARDLQHAEWTVPALPNLFLSAHTPSALAAGRFVCCSAHCSYA